MHRPDDLSYHPQTRDFFDLIVYTVEESQSYWSQLLHFFSSAIKVVPIPDSKWIDQDKSNHLLQYKLKLVWQFLPYPLDSCPHDGEPQYQLKQSWHGFAPHHHRSFLIAPFFVKPSNLCGCYLLSHQTF